MSIALFISTPTTDGAGSAQTLLVPNVHSADVDIYHRISTGKRGRAEAWVKGNLSDIPETVLTHEPVAVRLSAGDEVGIQIGKVTQIAVKAITAFEGAPLAVKKVTHNEAVRDLYIRLHTGDGSLGQYLVDGRMSNKHLSLTPIISNDSEPTSAPEKVAVSAGVRTELASVPDVKWSQKYIHRKVAGGLSEFEVYDSAMRNHKNVLIKGHAGSGKTMSVLAYASQRGHRYYNVSSHIGVEPSQLFGKWNPTEDGHFRWQDGAVTDLVRNGGVLLLNEVNFLPERVTTVLFSLLDDRREIQLMDKDGEVVKAHPDLLIVADMNPSYRGTRQLNEAWNDRFHHHLDFPYDPAIEKQLIPSASIREVATSLRSRFEQDEITTPISTRSLLAFYENAQELGLDYAISSYVSTFHSSEQAPVKLVIETSRYNIELDLGIAQPVVAEAPEVDSVTGIGQDTSNVSNQDTSNVSNEDILNILNALKAGN